MHLYACQFNGIEIIYDLRILKQHEHPLHSLWTSTTYCHRMCFILSTICLCLRLRSQTIQAQASSLLNHDESSNEKKNQRTNVDHFVLHRTQNCNDDWNRMFGHGPKQKEQKNWNYYRIMSSSMIISAINNTYTDTRWNYVGFVGTIIKTRGLMLNWILNAALLKLNNRSPFKLLIAIDFSICFNVVKFLIRIRWSLFF